MRTPGAALERQAPLLRASELAAILNISLHTLYRRLAEGAYNHVPPPFATNPYRWSWPLVQEWAESRAAAASLRSPATSRRPAMKSWALRSGSVPS